MSNNSLTTVRSYLDTEIHISITAQGTSESIALFHEILHTIDCAWPWHRQRRQGSVCETCGGPSISMPSITPQDVKAAGRQAGCTKVSVWKWSPGSNCRVAGKSYVNSKWITGDEWNNLYLVKPSGTEEKSTSLQLITPIPITCRCSCHDLIGMTHATGVTCCHQPHEQRREPIGVQPIVVMPNGVVLREPEVVVAPEVVPPTIIDVTPEPSDDPDETMVPVVESEESLIQQVLTGGGGDLEAWDTMNPWVC